MSSVFSSLVLQLINSYLGLWKSSHISNTSLGQAPLKPSTTTLILSSAKMSETSVPLYICHILQPQHPAALFPTRTKAGDRTTERSNCPSVTRPTSNTPQLTLATPNETPIGRSFQSNFKPLMPASWTYFLQSPNLLHRGCWSIAPAEPHFLNFSNRSSICMIAPKVQNPVLLRKPPCLHVHH